MENGGRDGLESWHPAHMPESTSVPHNAQLRPNEFAQQPPLDQDVDDKSLLDREPLQEPKTRTKDPEPALLLQEDHVPETSTIDDHIDPVVEQDDNSGAIKFGPKSTEAGMDASSRSHGQNGGMKELGSNKLDSIKPSPPPSASGDKISEVRNDDAHSDGRLVEDLAIENEAMLEDFSKFNRTNSFPDVPPLHHTESVWRQAPSQSQVENILEEDEGIVKAVQESSYADLLRQSDTAPRADDDFFGMSMNCYESPLFSNSTVALGATGSLSPADDEARFEEGLPLVPSASILKERAEVDADKDDLFGPSDGHNPVAEEDFFSQDQGLDFSRPQPLDRKTTGQVLSSIDDNLPRGIHENPTPRQESVMVDRQESKMPVSTSASVTHTLEADISRPIKRASDQESNQREQDLAAMWQAALDDDELLDENPTLEGLSSANRDFFSPADQQSSLVKQSQFPDTISTFPDQRMEGFAQDASNTRSSSASSQNRYLPSSSQSQRNTPSPYLPNVSATTQPQPAVQSSYGISQSISAPAGFGQTPMQPQTEGKGSMHERPNMPKPTQSFSDKAKGGYSSPYDLPMDLTRPKKRTNLQQVQSVSNLETSSQRPPPPRSSSMYVKGSPTSTTTPPPPLLQGAKPLPPSGRPSSSNTQPKPSIGTFFEELPITKPRPSSSASNYLPPAPQQTYGTAQLAEPPRQQNFANRPTSSSSSTSQTYQLLPPEKHNPYASFPHQEPANQVPQPINSRYSPAPVPPSHVPPPRNRYASSPSGGSRPPPPSQAIPFQPRTSSPLAQNSLVPQQHRKASVPTEIPDRPTVPQKGIVSQRSVPTGANSSVPPFDGRFEPNIGKNMPEKPPEQSKISPVAGFGQQVSQSRGNYAPFESSPSSSAVDRLTPESEHFPASHLQTLGYQSQLASQSTVDDVNFGPPRRSQTQSPGAVRSKPEPLNQMKDIYQRPASVNSGAPPNFADLPSSAYVPSTNRVRSSSTNQNLNFIRPVDGRENDPLERWKGCPIIIFGFGGTTVTSFPKQIPRYTTGHGFPMIKCSAGEVKLSGAKTFALDSNISSFPGPLKSKGKKKEVLEWIQKKITAFEAVHASTMADQSLPDFVKRHEEKILLWKIMKVFVEFDGAVEGNEKADPAVRAIITPNLAMGAHVDTVSGAPLSSLSSPNRLPQAIKPMDPRAFDAMRQLLLQGEREKAVWQAVDQRLWPHAMVLASKLDNTVWKKVLHEFTHLEVKSLGEDAESMAALYEIFAGNWEESVDELVPLSARAGLQMVSKAAFGGPTKNALAGLEKWRETLALILSNRTPNDGQALVALGRLLSDYGRIEAAHLCFIFAKSPGLFGGPDDQQVSIALLGANHQQQPFDYSRDINSILLTEVYEFARSVLAPASGITVSPHLQSYKLYHAMILSENGCRVEAQQYCESIMNTMKSSTKPSPYYHKLLYDSLDDLAQRLRQAPREESSWMSKPMDKVSGTFFQRFNNFIVGDESDTGSTASGKGDQDAGPFARVAADTPSISRSGSSTDLYGAYAPQAGPPPPAATSFGSRYAPNAQLTSNGQYTPRSSLETQGRPSQELQRPYQPENLRPSASYTSQSQQSSRVPSSTGLNHEPSKPEEYKNAYQPSPYESPKPETYLPTPPSQPDNMSMVVSDDLSNTLYNHGPNQYPLPSELVFSQSRVLAPQSDFSSAYHPSASEYNHQASTYEPPSVYAPTDAEGQDNEESPNQKSPRKKKSFMDDDSDDEMTSRQAAMLKKEREQKDRDADEAFRKAAEADGMSYILLLK